MRSPLADGQRCQRWPHGCHSIRSSRVRKRMRKGSELLRMRKGSELLRMRTARASAVRAAVRSAAGLAYYTRVPRDRNHNRYRNVVVYLVVYNVRNVT